MMAARVFLLLCVTFWGWTFIATKIVLDYMSPVELLGLRFAIGLPVLLIVILTKRLKFDFNNKEIIDTTPLIESNIFLIRSYEQHYKLLQTKNSPLRGPVWLNPLVLTIFIP